MSPPSSSEAKRPHSSKIERDPSPKRSRRDGKPKTERNTSRSYDLDTLDSNDHDQKPHRRLKDALPLEAPLEPESKAAPEIADLDSKKYNDIKHSSDPTEVPRSRSYFQHDDRERGLSGQGGRNFYRRATTERGGWTNRKDRYNEKPRDRRDYARVSHRRDDENVWRHDRFHEVEKDAPPARKRPAFREKKIEQESEISTQITGTDSTRSNSRVDRYMFEKRRRDAWDGRRSYDRAQPLHRRERYGGGGGPMGRDRFSGRYDDGHDDLRQDGTEKWEHDLFDKANMSPSPKSAEDQIAKVEALLAS
ncbi:hypothetical protein ACHQM5_024919 [Ranunculus cassubicifolius]